MPKSLRKIARKHFGTTEVLLIVSSIGGSVASIIFQQVAFAAITSIPLSLAVSFSSYNRKRLDETNQQQASIIQLEQQFLNHKEFVNEVLYSLPNRSELAGLERLLKARTTVFTEQLGKLKEQINTYLELQQVNSWHSEVCDVQQRLCVVESLIELYNPSQLRTELQEIQASVEGKAKKLDQQFHNLPISNLQYQLSQIEELVKKLQVNSTEHAQLNKYFLGEIQSISQQVQTLTGRTEELSFADREFHAFVARIEGRIIDSDSSPNNSKVGKLEEIEQLKKLFHVLQTGITTSTELNQHLTEEVQSLRQQVQAVSSNVSERISSLQVELQKQIVSGRKFEHKISTDLYELTNWYRKLDQQLQNWLKNNSLNTSSKQRNKEPNISLAEMQSRCEYCSSICQAQSIQGGEFLNYKFCSRSCKKEYEKRNC